MQQRPTDEHQQQNLLHAHRRQSDEAGTARRLSRVGMACRIGGLGMAHRQLVRQQLRPGFVAFKQITMSIDFLEAKNRQIDLIRACGE